MCWDRSGPSKERRCDLCFTARSRGKKRWDHLGLIWVRKQRPRRKPVKQRPPSGDEATSEDEEEGDNLAQHVFGALSRAGSEAGSVNRSPSEMPIYKLKFTDRRSAREPQAKLDAIDLEEKKLALEEGN
ncbi:hypothetical protein NDU88_001334 [Pleurodeles waltl]|uniref:Uncharacterized protein n=1 Tax=Pleurodeles waltl TaxID=8319 RepID=A0AAV7LL59_PLEWA|nr:hypothetical protein NDU88_001334 [Pleurodeles waltl]